MSEPEGGRPAVPDGMLACDEAGVVGRCIGSLLLQDDPPARPTVGLVDSALLDGIAHVVRIAARGGEGMIIPSAGALQRVWIGKRLGRVRRKGRVVEAAGSYTS